MRFPVLAGVLLVVSACALRPRYNDFIARDSTARDARFVVIDTDTGTPVEGAKVEVSELKNRIIATTDAKGEFTLPIDKKYVAENPIFVVSLPKGVTSYRVELVKTEAQQEPPALIRTDSDSSSIPQEVISTPQETPGTIVEVNDGGVPASN